MLCLWLWKGIRACNLVWLLLPAHHSFCINCSWSFPRSSSHCHWVSEATANTAVFWTLFHLSCMASDAWIPFDSPHIDFQKQRMISIAVWKCRPRVQEVQHEYPCLIWGCLVELLLLKININLFAYVHGGRFAETGEALVTSVDKVIFVGSTGVGRKVQYLDVILDNLTVECSFDFGPYPWEVHAFHVCLDPGTWRFFLCELVGMQLAHFTPCWYFSLRGKIHAELMQVESI